MGLSKGWIYTYLTGMVLWGSSNTILLSLQFSEYSLGVKYGHPWFQTLTMFMGEIYCLFVYYLMSFLKERKRKRKEQGLLNSIPNEEKSANKEEDEDDLEDGPMVEVLIDGTPTMVKREASPFLIFIPSICDFAGSTLLAFALLNMETSIYQMLRGYII